MKRILCFLGFHYWKQVYQYFVQYPHDKEEFIKTIGFICMNCDVTRLVKISKELPENERWNDLR